MADTGEQASNRHDKLEALKVKEKKSRVEHLQPWQYKKGQSGNPSGRAPGIVSLKEYAKRMLASMNDEEREKFMNGLSKDIIWKMAEGMPETQTDITSKGEKLEFQVVTYGENNNPPPQV